ncbi:CarD family transcriptional regulator [Alkaliphilus peptidifermentans]|uniref:Transcriptional regulator, CarD family n=1 Tax=Alkaliphilus peptidifermentans DSM 18978 TaxID=1120976 RepID=A0A1G5KYG3_9FIRM|nr:CarD family transcriptional regulator [Alkaliphilus peptidifermentans]SCZ05627.1 transcriptional regulator, CarD family [Alkaliphilus peptidifermentans DSM 18978]
MYNIGDKIVYPMHGAGIIEEIEEKEILGVRRKYYIMKMPLDDMRVMIPLDTIDGIGIRPVIPNDEVEKVIGVLEANETKMPQNWNRRYRANMDRLKTGDIYEVAEVVRNLVLRDREKSLSTGERKILNNARQILLSEVILATGLVEEEVKILIENSIK